MPNLTIVPLHTCQAHSFDSLQRAYALALDRYRNIERETVVLSSLVTNSQADCLKRIASAAREEAVSAELALTQFAVRPDRSLSAG